MGLRFMASFFMLPICHQMPWRIVLRRSIYVRTIERPFAIFRVGKNKIGRKLIAVRVNL